MCEELDTGIIMSDDEKELDVESAEKRAHHNALERKRRDHIKDSFSSLRDSVPSLQGEKVASGFQASRAQILKRAADYIQLMRKRNTTHQTDIDDLKRQNTLLEAQIRTLEKSRPPGSYVPEDLEDCDREYRADSTNSDTSDSETMHSSQRKSKKLKVAGL